MDVKEKIIRMATHESMEIECRSEVEDILNYFGASIDNLKEQPTWIHDCEDCIYLGSTDPYFNKKWRTDLYFCPNEPTIIARKSSKPEDYKSGLSLADHDNDLYTARRRAIVLGLIAEEVL